MQTHNKRVVDAREDVALHFSTLAVSHLKRGLLQYFHCIQSACIWRSDLTDEKNLAKRAFAKYFEQLEVRLGGLFAAFFGYVFYFDFGLVLVEFALIGHLFEFVREVFFVLTGVLFAEFVIVFVLVVRWWPVSLYFWWLVKKHLFFWEIWARRLTQGLKECEWKGNK